MTKAVEPYTDEEVEEILFKAVNQFWARDDGRMSLAT